MLSARSQALSSGLLIVLAAAPAAANRITAGGFQDAASDPPTTSMAPVLVGDGRGRPERDCYIGLAGYDDADLVSVNKRGTKLGIRCTDCDPTCDLDGVAVPDGSCTFRIAACVNDPDVDRCDPTTRTPKKVRARAKSKAGKIDLGVALPNDLRAACGDLVDFRVPLMGKKRNKPGKGTVKLLAKKPTDTDKFVFVCDPRPAGEACLSPPTTTTTVSGSTTTTTLPGPACRSRSVSFRIGGDAGTPGTAEWPGGTEVRSFEPGCELTVALPSGPIDAGGDAFSVVSVNGYAACFGAGGDDDAGCGVASCPSAETGTCMDGRPRCPTAVDESARATFRVRCLASDWSPSTYVENLLVKERTGQWTRGEGLVATLRFFAGELGRESVLGDAELTWAETTGIFAMAREHLGDGGDASAQAEIVRLLGELTWSAEQLDGMAGAAAAQAESLVVAQTEQENCAAFFKDVDVSPGVGKCLKKDAFTVNGKPYATYAPDPSLPQAGWTDDHYAWAKQAVTDSVTEYDLLGTSPPAATPETLVVFSVRSRPDALADAASHRAPCVVTIYTDMQSQSEASFKQVLAHEVAHCLQGVVLAMQNQAGYETKKWREEGLAEYLSNWVYPDTDAEWDWTSTLQTRELSTTLLQRDYDNFIFFQYLANTIGNDGIIQVVSSLPASGGTAAQAAGLAAYPGMAELYHDFVKAVSDVDVDDTSGATVPYMFSPGVNVEIFTVAGPTIIPEDLDAFGMLRYLIEIDPDQQADMMSLKQGDVLASSRPQLGNDWGEVPTKLPDRCFNSAIVASATKPNASFDLDITEVVDVPGQCRLEGVWLVDNESLNIMRTTYTTDYVVGEIRGTFREDGTVEVVYDGFEFRVSDDEELTVGGIDLVRHEEFTHTTNASGVTTYEIDGTMLRFGSLFESAFLEGTEIIHHIRFYEPPAIPGTDEIIMGQSPGEDVFAGSPTFTIDGTLRLSSSRREIVLHRIGDVPP